MSWVLWSCDWEQLLGAPPIFHGDSCLAKVGSDDPTVGEQDMHLDYAGNTLLVSPAQPEQVACILYYADYDDVGGSTKIVPNGLCELVREPGDPPAQPPRAALAESDEALYSREQGFRYKRGTVFMYNLCMLHRGSPVLPGKVRRTHHLNFRRPECEWIGNSTWARGLAALEEYGRSANSSCAGFNRRDYLARLSEIQRVALGMQRVESVESHSKQSKL